jgi:subtilase family protein
MKRAFGGWGVSRRRLEQAIIAGAVSMFLSTITLQPPANTPMVSVLVRKVSAADVRPERAVERIGGRLVRPLGIIDGFVAKIPQDALASLQSSAGVRSVSLDRVVRPMHAVDGFDGATDAGSMYNTTKIVKAHDLWRNGITGEGVDVALIDSGVVPVNGLRTRGKVINGPDLSFESQSEDLRYLDTYGHGTHMAGIIAGRGDQATATGAYTHHDYFVGVAPDARIVNVKVAESSGATDVSQVIAAIDWVVQNRAANGLNIRVLNISFGTDSTQPYTDDPLAYAAEVAWRKGIVVVVAAGNGGSTGSSLSDPASDPYLLSVGADDPHGTANVDDDTIPAWSSRGDGQRNPSLVAPGRSIVSLRDPGSNIDVNHPEGRVNASLFRGSGTSQAAAVVSGAAALLLEQRPELTPDQVKDLLTSTATPIPGADETAQGAGLINLKAAATAITRPFAAQTHPVSTGLGSLETARGSAHVAMNGVELTGEQDIFGAEWNPNVSAAGETRWSGGTWNGNVWSGDGWGGSSWTSSTWSSISWSSSSWSGSAWYSSSWSSSSWSGSSWSSISWSSSSWSSSSWSSSTWSSSTWSSNAWE